MLTPEDLSAIRIMVTEIVTDIVKKENKKLERRLERKFDKKINEVIDYFETRLMRHHERLDRIEQHLGIYDNKPDELKLYDKPARNKK